ncbi:MAG: transposase [Burkholderiaceae bacterium]
MTRLPRYVIPGHPQHIIQRGNNRQAIFAAGTDYRFFRDALIAAAHKHGLRIHAYVWMTNHIHLLATPEQEDSMGKVFQSVGRRYVQYFNHTHQRSGTLWEGRYRATVIDSEQYLLTVMRYIELNPVRAGMVTHPRDYPWSSYAYNASGERNRNTDWLAPHDEYMRLGGDAVERQRAYRQLFRAAASEDELKSIRECTHKGWALGDEGFRGRIERASGRQAASKGVGRPRQGAVEAGAVEEGRPRRGKE